MGNSLEVAGTDHCEYLALASNLLDSASEEGVAFVDQDLSRPRCDCPRILEQLAQ